MKKKGENPIIWRHFQNFDDVIAKRADVIIICDELWVQNIFFLKEDLSTFKMRGQAFSYDNPFKSYRFFNFDVNYDVILTSSRQKMTSQWRHRQFFDVDRFLGQVTIIPSNKYSGQIFEILTRGAQSAPPGLQSPKKPRFYRVKLD